MREARLKEIAKVSRLTTEQRRKIVQRVAERPGIDKELAEGERAFREFQKRTRRTSA